MDNIEYNIVLKTTLGLRAGSLTLSKDGNILRGTLEILGNRTPVVGTLSDDGQCTLTGIMKTLLNSYPFSGEGTIDRQQVSLKLRVGKNTFPLKGNMKERDKK